MSELPRVLAVVGPTATGKSDAAMELAAATGARIFACDSVQVYRGLDIGSAKPSADDRRRVPHALIDLVDPDEEFSAGRYASQALELLEGDAIAPTILCGGTGLYLQSLAWTQSIDASGDLSREDPRRREFEAHWEAREAAAPGAVARELARRDAATAAGIHEKNVVRAMRALWLCERLGQPVSEVRAQNPPRLRIDLRCVYIEAPAERLRAQIEARCDAMMAKGWLGEVEKLLAAGYHPALKSMRSLGYKQLCAHLEQGADLDQAVDDIKRETWAYARRQRTWFRHQLPEARTTRVERFADLAPTERRSLEHFVLGKEGLA